MMNTIIPLASAHSEPETIIDLIPGISTWGEPLGKTWLNQAPIAVTHVVSTVFAIAVIVFLVATTWNKFKPAADAKLTPRTFFEMILDAIMGLMTAQMGKENAKKYLPLIGTLAIFIFFNNACALLPGMAPSTDNLNTNVGLALLVFFVSNIAGIRHHGFFPYMAHFFGPVRNIYALPLMLLMFPIEIIGQLARPLSLSIRLMGNMFGDHATVAVLLLLFPFIIPIPMLLLGVLVVILQTVVFSLLSVVYISMAIADEH